MVSTPRIVPKGISTHASPAMTKHRVYPRRRWSERPAATRQEAKARPTEIQNEAKTMKNQPTIWSGKRVLISVKETATMPMPRKR